MKIHADLSQRAVVDGNRLPWRASPLPGVDRRMLERDGGEIARATSIVRYAPGSFFAEHEHSGGEEFFVLDGVFSDESGDYPQGWYVRNPIGSRHRPHTEEGTTILVKLQQFQRGDDEYVRTDTHSGRWSPSGTKGLSHMPLHAFGTERVCLARLAPATRMPERTYPAGLEIFVLDGEFRDEHGAYPQGTWIRSPAGFTNRLETSSGARLLVKTGHLPGSGPRV
jgi:anti-sigma factor ChrR (cupin superfamily)